MRNRLTLLWLTFVVAFATLQYGGVTAREWNIALLALCVGSLLFWLPDCAASPASPPSRALFLLIAALIFYVAFQLLPLPVEFLRIISPARVEISTALERIHTVSQWMPVSLSPQLTFNQLLKLLAYATVFFLVRELTARSKPRIWVTAVPLIILGLCEACIGLVQHFVGGGYAVGSYVNHGHFAGLLEMVLPLTLALIPITLRRAKDNVKTVVVCMLIVCAGALLLALLYSGSRMSLTAAAVAMAVLAVAGLGSRRNRSGAMAVAAGVSLSLLLLAAPLSLIARYEGGLTSESRFVIWHDTLALASNYPIFGCGLGTFVSGIQKYLSFSPPGLVDYAHNDYLQLFAELGAAGSLLLTALAVVFIRLIAIPLRERTRQSERLLVAGCAASLAAIAVHSLVDFQYYIPANAMVAAWIAGIISGIAAIERHAAPK